MGVAAHHRNTTTASTMANRVRGIAPTTIAGTPHSPSLRSLATKPRATPTTANGTKSQPRTENTIAVEAMLCADRPPARDTRPSCARGITLSTMCPDRRALAIASDSVGASTRTEYVSPVARRHSAEKIAIQREYRKCKPHTIAPKPPGRGFVNPRVSKGRVEP